MYPMGALLTYEMIEFYVRNNLIQIRPEVKWTVEDGPNGEPAGCDMTSVELTMGSLVLEEGGGEEFFEVNPWRQSVTTFIQEHYREVVVPRDQTYALRPGRCILVNTEQTLLLPTAREGPLAEYPLVQVMVTGRSRLARLCLTTELAPMIKPSKDPRPIALEICNLSSRNIVHLEPGMPIAAGSFVTTFGRFPVERTNGFTQKQDHPAGAHKAVLRS